MAAVTLQQKLTLGLAALLIIVGGTMVYDSISTDTTQTQTFTKSQESQAAAWAMPEPTGTADATSPVIGKSAVTKSTRAIAQLTFLRPSTNKSLVHATPLYVGEGTDDATLSRGPGHYVDTALPGEPGNVAIAGHRTGWGSPFLRLNDLKRDDLIVLTMPDGTAFTYRVLRTRIVEPSNTKVLGQGANADGDHRITLTTCDPPHTSDRRMIVQGVLVA